VAVQTNDGVWRAEDAWPPADAAEYTSPLRTGTYTDDGTAEATGSSATNGVWTISPPLPYDAHLSGSGKAVVEVSTAFPNANLVVDVYDLDSSGRGPLVTRQGHGSARAARSPSTCGRPTGSSGRATGSPSACRTPTRTGGCTRRRSRR
jgi:hypothetical protein